MVICFLSEIYPPFGSGGAEQSTVAQATALVRRGVKIVVLTPNWGAARRETVDGVDIERIPWPWRAERGKAARPTRLVNPVSYLYLALWIAWRAWRRGADILHIQTKHMLVPGVWAATLIGCKTVLTIRDLGVICHAPMCLLKAPVLDPVVEVARQITDITGSPSLVYPDGSHRPGRRFVVLPD